MTAADREVCGVERFLHSSGPSRVPLKACCAVAILHFAEGDHPGAPFVCADADRLSSRTQAGAGRRTDVDTAPIAAGGRA